MLIAKSVTHGSSFKGNCEVTHSLMKPIIIRMSRYPNGEQSLRMTDAREPSPRGNLSSSPSVVIVIWLPIRGAWSRWVWRVNTQEEKIELDLATWMVERAFH